MKKKLTLEVIDFIEGTTRVVDESPIVNDKDYVDVVTTPNELKYLVDGTYNSVSGKTTHEELLKKAIETAVWDEWFLEGEYKTFEELGLTTPVVYNPEECTTDSVNGVGNYINNCKFLVSDEEYNAVKQSLLEIAKREVKITVKGIKLG